MKYNASVIRHKIHIFIKSGEGRYEMNFLEEKIIKDGIVKEGNVLKVDSFGESK